MADYFQEGGKGERERPPDSGTLPLGKKTWINTLRYEMLF